MYTNVWYVAAFAKDLTDAPLQFRAMGADLVLFRDADGVAQCISNLCPHRGASLAQGCLYKDGTLACPFHGYRFNGQGECTVIPSRRDHDPQVVLPGVKTDAYAVQEKYGLIWVCLGDDPDAAAPIFDMPEADDDEYRGAMHEEIWEADYHTCKFTNLDLVHLPVVHGISFKSQENPIQPPDHKVTLFDDGYTSVHRSNTTPSAGVWSEMREKDTFVESTMRFWVPGFTLSGKLEIGGMGSGKFNVFYEFSTPIDENRTMMRYIFFRNYRIEPEFDNEHVRRNLQNAHQDKRIAEAQRPIGALTGPRPEGLYTHDEDKITLTYWTLMERMRDKGWQLDRAQLGDPDHTPRIIPSPARKASPDGWVFPAMATLAATAAREVRVADLSYVDINAIEPTRPKDYALSEPLVPHDPLTTATLEWDGDALKRIEAAPEFVQPMIIENAEKAARERGTNFVTVQLLEELQAQQTG